MSERPIPPTSTGAISASLPFRQRPKWSAPCSMAEDNGLHGLQFKTKAGTRLAVAYLETASDCQDAWVMRVAVMRVMSM